MSFKLISSLTKKQSFKNLLTLNHVNAFNSNQKVVFFLKLVQENLYSCKCILINKIFIDIAISCRNPKLN